MIWKGLHKIFSCICSFCLIQARPECLLSAFFSCKSAAWKPISNSHLTRQGSRACYYPGPDLGASLHMCLEQKEEQRLNEKWTQTSASRKGGSQNTALVGYFRIYGVLLECPEVAWQSICSTHDEPRCRSKRRHNPRTTESHPFRKHISVILGLTLHNSFSRSFLAFPSKAGKWSSCSGKCPSILCQMSCNFFPFHIESSCCYSILNTWGLGWGSSGTLPA